VFLQEYIKKGNQESWRALVLTTTGTLIALQNDLSLIWQSEQSLAHVVDSHIVTASTKTVRISGSDEHAEFVPPTIIESLQAFTNTMQSSFKALLVRCQQCNKKNYLRLLVK
jgi:hypothetical protein